MSQYLVIERIKVQNANAISGFTWGFPAITHFLGFVHNLSRKLSDNSEFEDISVSGCAVVSHECKVHTYGANYEKRFTQTRNPAYLKADADKVAKGSSPSVIEEGKMNMTVSLIIECEGNIGNIKDILVSWIERNCFLQRLAGGSILSIKSIEVYSPQNDRDIRIMARKLLPGFILMDRSNYLEEHYAQLLVEDEKSELLDAWLDFSALKQKARPKKELIEKHLNKIIQDESENENDLELLSIWNEHIDKPFNSDNIPTKLRDYFLKMEKNKSNEKLLIQWQKYINPDDETEAIWEYLSKPKSGYLVPIMTGYKALSKVYKNSEVKNTRDSETDVCFVESVHSIGEWLSVHRIKTKDNIKESLWKYMYEEDWYLCKQGVVEDYNDNTSDDEDLIS